MTHPIPDLGIVEGFFGPRWSWAERTAVIDHLAPSGYRFYHYAPKADAHLRRDWRTPHPEAEARAIAAFADHCRARGVRFGIGLTPFELHADFDAAGRGALAERLASLDALGLDDLAILFDDMRGDVPELAERQAAITAFCAERTRATRLFMCPTYYSDDRVLDRVFGARPADYLQTLGRLLDPAIRVYWTGEEVCAREITPGHLRDVAERLGRPVCLWDNYPVNDGPRMSDHLHLRAFTGRSAANAAWLSGHAINPALQPLLGCIPAATLPILYRKAEAYRYMEAFRSAAKSIAGPELAAMLEANILSFDDAGLTRLTTGSAAMRARYAKIDHDCAREVLKWLDFGYHVSAENVQTQ
ncbi:beta-N-acetylglucosaminidase domain-containing protein [Sphingomonas sp. KR1UV-12]|uniref:Beta-N-acetylglucosaminidase domain-containing protein n=1 Tax=Sphingomonas aurea TaxID=3063994 RepID=A0ABT9EMI5_9SPHN|nr:beta-N-acetylglucosaminidase domain-containing protein [Sphingomonas sp. KR1UV-12]MDP1028167.1 beta-N-acetylglucosaminidase domain-containing protein [Sphingomonas sp. KR1UV-12]